MIRILKVYLLPGAILQSVMIGGGYGTGREVVEYFTSYGMMGGVLGIITAAVAVAVIFVLSLEISRQFGVYDYRNFFKILLGRAWFLYEILGAMLFMLVIAVIGAAAGQILKDELGLPETAGIAIMLFAVVFLVFYGRELVTQVLAYWSLFLYVVFISYLVAVFVLLGDDIATSFETPQNKPGWMPRGLQYTFYNVTAIPIILYCAREIETRAEAIGAGICGALIAIVPALMLHVSFAAQFPAILDAPLPVYGIFSLLDIGVLKFLYLLVLFGTFIETGAGNVQGFVERLDGWWRESHEQGLSNTVHAVVAGAAVMLAGGLSNLGIVALIADGYGTLAWGFMAVYVVPLLTIGVYRIYVSSGSDSD